MGQSRKFQWDPKRREGWLEIQINEQWIAALRVFMRGGQPSVAELRFFPGQLAETDTQPDGSAPPRQLGSWDAEREGGAAKAPERGLPAQVVNDFRLSRYAGLIPTAILDLQDALRRDLRVDFKRLGVPELRAIVKRRTVTDVDLARLADEYVRRLPEGKPKVRMAKDLKQPVGWIHERIREARNRGILTKPGKGHSGGALTDKAVRLLRGEPAEDIEGPSYLELLASEPLTDEQEAQLARDVEEEIAERIAKKRGTRGHLQPYDVAGKEEAERIERETHKKKRRGR